MAFVHGARLSSIHQLDLPFRVEQEADGVEELGLIGFDTHQVIATGIEHLLAEIALTDAYYYVTVHNINRLPAAFFQFTGTGGWRKVHPIDRTSG